MRRMLLRRIRRRRGLLRPQRRKAGTIVVDGLRPPQVQHPARREKTRRDVCESVLTTVTGMSMHATKQRAHKQGFLQSKIAGASLAKL